MKARLTLTYTLPIELPETLAQRPRGELERALDNALGEVVHQGLKTVAAKRLAGSGVSVTGLHHRLVVELPKREPGKVIDKSLLITAAPHLTDEELAELEARVGNVPFLASDELVKRLRVQALKIANEVRLTPVHVLAERSNGEPFEADAHLNITHGGLFFDEKYRSVRLKANAPVKVWVPGVEEPLIGRYQGATLGGPVVEVPIEALAPYRDRLLAGWLAQRGQ
ncbi:MAG: hypothetical protein N2557_05030 [Hydrogenophilus sp.]|nr:hypothetical protein [Hydrogenophilus sp.]